MVVILSMIKEMDVWNAQWDTYLTKIQSTV